jgi:predicted lipoprotein with Yx(FWY)xxD motif
VRRAFLGVPLAVLTGLLAAACGSSSSTSSASSANAPSTSGAAASTTSSSASSGPYSSGAAASSSAAGTSAGGGTPVKVTTKQSKFGTILAAGPKRLTVYLFEADKGPMSNCTGACAVAWPPVTAKGASLASGQASSADLGTITRSGGLKQLTYKGHPLYYFIKDKDDGDAYGQGAHAFGDDWYVLAPSGNKVDNS